MKTKLLLLLLLPFAIRAQKIDTKDYKWEKNPTLYKLTAEESKEPVVMILDKRFIEYAYNSNNESELYFTRHKIVHINESKAVDSYNKIYIPVISPKQLIEFRARSISKDGKIKEMTKDDMKETSEEGQTYMSVAVDGIEKGSELEYYFIIERNVAYTGSENIQSDVMGRTIELSIITPENLVMKAKTYNGTVEQIDTVIDEKRYIKMNFKNIPASYDEKYGIESSNLTRVEYKLTKNLSRGTSNLLTYADAGNGYYARINGLEKNEIKDVEKITSKLNLKNKSDLEKVRSIEAYIKTTFRINPEAEVENISQAVKTNIADEFIANKLCVALSKAAGLKPEIVVTISRYKKKFDPDFECYNFLSEVLIYYPSIDKYVYPTSLGVRVGPPPAEFTSSYALFIKEVGLGDIQSGVSTVKKLPDASSETSHDNMNIDIAFDKDMKKVTQKNHRSMSGFASIQVRPFYFYAQPDKKKELLEEIMKQDIDGAIVSSISAANSDMNTDEVDKDFQIDAEITYSSLLEKADNTYLFKVGQVIGTQVEMYQDKPRQKPMEIDFPHNLDRTIVVNIPAGYVAKGLDALNMNIIGGTAASPTMGFISSYTLNGNKLEIKIHEFYNNLLYPVSEYDSFRKVINASADFNKVTIVLEKAS